MADQLEFEDSESVRWMHQPSGIEDDIKRKRGSSSDTLLDIFDNGPVPLCKVACAMICCILVLSSLLLSVSLFTDPNLRWGIRVINYEKETIVKKTDISGGGQSSEKPFMVTPSLPSTPSAPSTSLLPAPPKASQAEHDKAYLETVLGANDLKVNTSMKIHHQKPPQLRKKGGNKNTSPSQPSMKGTTIKPKPPTIDLATNKSNSETTTTPQTTTSSTATTPQATTTGTSAQTNNQKKQEMLKEQASKVGATLRANAAAAEAENLASKTAIIKSEYDTVLKKMGIDSTSSAHTVTHVTPFPKNVYSNNSRLLLVAGLEGTGHHAISDMMSVCMKASPSKSCSEDVDLSVMMMHSLAPEKHQIGQFGLFFGEDANRAGQHIQTIESRMKELAKASMSHLYFLGLGKTAKTGMFSYPAFAGPFKAINHPDAFALAVMAEKSNLDFRILVLQRNHLEILASTHKRHFGGNVEARLLIHNAEALLAQLRLLDKRFYRCVDYKTLNKIDDVEKKRLQNFLHPVVLRNSLTGMLKQLHYNNHTTPPSKHKPKASPQTGQMQSLKVQPTALPPKAKPAPKAAAPPKMTTAKVNRRRLNNIDVQYSPMTAPSRGTGNNANANVNIEDLGLIAYEANQLASRLSLIDELCAEANALVP